MSDDARYFHTHCQEMLDAVGLRARSEDILDVIDGHKGQGYAIATQEELGVKPVLAWAFTSTLSYTSKI